jgi:peptide deformylase
VVREVLRYPDRRLKLPTASIGRPGPAAHRLAADLVETAASFPRTIGIAAPQVGELWRMAYVDCTGHPKVPDAQGPLWLIDPVVDEAEGEAIGREGCLSLPEITANVRRATRIVVTATDLDGTRRRIDAAGFEARVILHEMDHLDGILILDRVASLSLDVFPRRR